MSAPKSLQIGVMLEAVQLSDVIGIDIFGSISKVYMEPIAAFYATEHPDLAALLPQLAPEITLHYIASTLEVSHFTPGIGLGFVPTTTYATCPHDLDILIIGGPLPTHMPADSTKFIKDVAENGKTVVMSVCTGGMWLANSGVLKGKKATAQREVLPLLKTVHPEVEWLDQRWVVDGNFWTAGGAGCGLDMIIEYIKGRFDERLVGIVLKALQVGTEEGQFYKD